MTKFHCGSVIFDGVEYKEFEKIKNHLEQNSPQTNGENWEHAWIYHIEKKEDWYTVHVSDELPMAELDQEGNITAIRTYEVDILCSDID